MKIIISHDVDHCKWTDHFKDLFIIKYLGKAILHLLAGKISFRTAIIRILAPLNNRQHRLPELCAFDNQHNIPATFFVGMDNALGLMYGHGNAKKMIEFIRSKGFETGVHGIAFTDRQKIMKEFADFEKLTGISPKGIRMHYLRWQSDTGLMLAETGYRFDSTEYKTGDPEIHDNGITEFPVCMMDVYELTADERNPEAAVAASMGRINHAASQGLKYFTIIFHDTYFCNAYPQYEYWYKNLVIALKKSGYTFTDFNNAMTELNKNHFPVER